MSNDVENCPAEEFMKLCFADDSGKDGHKFWENFAKLRVDVWSKKENENGQCPSIYNYRYDYDSLPDPDANSDNLYEAHIKLWNMQCKKFVHINNVSYNKKSELKVHEKSIRVSSDSIMNIYWHRTAGNMPDIMKKIYKDVNKLQDAINKLKPLLSFKEEDIRSYNDMCNNKNYSLYKEFIWYYLQYSNTIGGFILFPRHNSSINQARGTSEKVQDRFDLTLECIRRAYQYGDFYKRDINPLFGISNENKEFFKMFGTFENYIRFFCLDAWVNESFTAVYDLLSEGGREILPTEDWPKEILPCDYTNEEEKVAKWWTFYNNIMNRLDARNAQIKKLIQQEGD